PLVQNARRRISGPDWPSANATDSSTIRWAPTALVSGRGPSTSATANPNGRCRVLSSSPVGTPATGPPPASTLPTALNWAPPANTSSEMTTGTQTGSPPATAIAPNEAPTTASARQTRATSRLRVVVRSAERMFTRMDRVAGVRQAEQMDLRSEHDREPTPAGS